MPRSLHRKELPSFFKIIGRVEQHLRLFFNLLKFMLEPYGRCKFSFGIPGKSKAYKKTQHRHEDRCQNRIPSPIPESKGKESKAGGKKHCNGAKQSDEGSENE